MTNEFICKYLSGRSVLIDGDYLFQRISTKSTLLAFANILACCIIVKTGNGRELLKTVSIRISLYFFSNTGDMPAFSELINSLWTRPKNYLFIINSIPSPKY
jgi:hypothetical protein